MKAARTVKVGVLVSGRGSNLQAIIDAIEDKRLEAKVEVVVSDVETAYALERAKKHNIAGRFVDPKPYKGKGREEYDQAVVAVLKEYNVELVCMAGFMRILSPYFIREYRNRIMNIHPALLPSFPGLHVQKKALDHGVKFSGATVHFADEGTDTGPIIIQAVVPILDDDTEDTLSARILRFEHQIYPRAIQLYAEGRLEVVGRRVICKDSGDSRVMGAINP